MRGKNIVDDELKRGLGLSRCAPKAKRVFLGWCALPMRNVFAVARLTPVLSFVVVAILVFSIFALLKISSGGKQEPGQELLTGSIQKSPAVRKPPSDDPVASFVAPSSFQPTLRRVQIGVVVRTPVPLPRPRPKRI